MILRIQNTDEICYGAAEVQIFWLGRDELDTVIYYQEVTENLVFESCAFNLVSTNVQNAITWLKQMIITNLNLHY